MTKDPKAQKLTLAKAREEHARLQAEIARSMREPAMAARVAQLGMVMEENGTSHYAAFMREDMARYEQAVRKLNLQQPK